MTTICTDKMFKITTTIFTWWPSSTGALLQPHLEDTMTAFAHSARQTKQIMLLHGETIAYVSRCANVVTVEYAETLADSGMHRKIIISCDCPDSEETLHLLLCKEKDNNLGGVFKGVIEKERNNANNIN